MTTSREVLGVPGETVFQVPPLALPDPADLPSFEALSHYEAVQLFVERAQSALPGFALMAENAAAVVEICRRLDGIPLAIELAAARVRLLRVEEIAGRLDDRFRLLANGGRAALPRHRALRAAIDWSYDLLTADEQALLRRLSVFAGGWTLAGAEAVNSEQWTVDSEQWTVNSGQWTVCSGQWTVDSGQPELNREYWLLDTVSSLVNKSLVVVERRPGVEARYHLLETIRQYTLEKLVDSGEAEAVRPHHLRFFLELAETAEPELHGPDQIAWLNRLDGEHDNLRAALAYAVDQDVEAGLRLMVALWPFWQARGYAERSQWLARFMAVPEPLPRTVAGARLRSLAAAYTSDPEEAERLFAESMAICGEVGDRRAMASSLYLQAHVAWWQDYQRARSLFEQSLALYRELDDRWGMAEVLRDLGELAQVHHEHRATARALMEESLRLCREAGDRRGVAMALVHLGDVVQEQGDLVIGQAYCQEGLDLSKEVGYKPGILWGYLCLGIIAWGQGDYKQAVVRLEEALSSTREMGTREFEALALYWLATAVRFQGDDERAARMYEENVAVSREAGLPWIAGHSLYGLGEIARARDDLEAARALHTEALATLRDLDFRWAIAYCLDVLAMLAVARQVAKRAARLFGAAEALREALGSALYPVERPEHETFVIATRAALGDEVFAAAWAEGRALPLDQAIAYALAERLPESPIRET
jgi:predicted ATPase